MESPLFKTLGLNDWIVKQCQVLGVKDPTPIQTNCIPQILSGQDCIGCAKTGSGKTAAFALPILQKLCEDMYGIFALVLTPTRELAYQITEQFQALGKPIATKVSVITGGRDMVQQSIELSAKPHIVIATPGRLADHIESGTNFSLRKIQFLVLDEADRLLEDNFGEQLEKIFSQVPQKRQTLLFSATMTDTLRDLEVIAMNKPFVFQSTDPVATVESLKQKYVLTPADVKDAYLLHILDKFQEENEHSLIMVFTNTCKYCQVLAMVCHSIGLKVQALHSMLSQKDRIKALDMFRSHQCQILLATDVASRGLDIPAVDLVINHNVPSVAKNYVHRVGRTARAGRQGSAITLVTQFDIKELKKIEEHINSQLDVHSVDDTEVAKIATEVSVAKSEALIKLEERDFGLNQEINKKKHQVMEEEESAASRGPSRGSHPGNTKKLKRNMQQSNKKLGRKSGGDEKKRKKTGTKGWQVAG